MRKFVGLRAKIYSCSRDEGSEDKQTKGTKKVCHKKKKLNLKIIKTV